MTTCCTKVAYRSKREAMTVINAILTGHGRKNRPERLRAYHCPDCNLWHVTKGRNSRFQKPLKVEPHGKKTHRIRTFANGVFDGEEEVPAYGL